MTAPDPARDCEHGQLARSCDRCADAREIAELRAEVARLRGICTSLHDRLLRGDSDADLLALAETGWKTGK